MREIVPPTPQPLNERRPLLFAIAYRISDARYGERRRGHGAGDVPTLAARARCGGGVIANPQGWLTTTITHLCID